MILFLMYYYCLHFRDRESQEAQRNYVDCPKCDKWLEPKFYFGLLPENGLGWKQTRPLPTRWLQAGETDIQITKIPATERSLLNTRTSGGSRPVDSSLGLSAPFADEKTEAQKGEETCLGPHT